MTTHPPAAAELRLRQPTIPDDFWGPEVRIDLHDCPVGLILDRPTTQRFVAELLELTGMTPYGEFQWLEFGHGLAKTSGPSYSQWLQLVETSALTAHATAGWGSRPGVGAAFLNVFTCALFPYEAAVDLAVRWFEPESHWWDFTRRGDRTRR
jgi:S-adenosylmethionine decarboxylase